jgi:hypothetical protein
MTQPRPFPKDDEDEPAWTQAPPAPVRHGLGDSQADLIAIQRTSTGTYLALGVGLAVLLGFGGFLLFKGSGSSTAEKGAASSTGAVAQPNPAEQGTTGAAAVAVAPVDAGPPPVVDAGPPDAGPPPVVDAGPPDAGPPPVVDAGPPAVVAAAPQNGAGGGNGGGNPAVKKPDADPDKPPAEVDVNGLLERAFKARESDKAQRALELYDQAAKLKPTSADIWSGRGMALIDLSRNSEAKDSFEKALRLAPNLSEAHMGLAEVLKAQGNKAEAIKHYQMALDTGTSEAAVAQRAIDELKSGN